MQLRGELFQRVNHCDREVEHVGSCWSSAKQGTGGVQRGVRVVSRERVTGIDASGPYSTPCLGVDNGPRGVGWTISAIGARDKERDMGTWSARQLFGGAECQLLTASAEAVGIAQCHRGFSSGHEESRLADPLRESHQMTRESASTLSRITS